MDGRAVALGKAAGRQRRDDDQGEGLYHRLADALAAKAQLVDLVWHSVVGEDRALLGAVAFFGELGA